MASLGHVALGLAVGRAYAGAGSRARRAMALFAAMSMAPDLDVIGMRLGVPYGATWGHRGATHSIAMSMAVGLAVALLLRDTHRFRVVASLAIAVVASHGILDALTDGGRGVALLWPATDARFFFPWRPIPVAPIGTRLFSPRGLYVVLWEAVVFGPAWIWALWPRKGCDGSRR